MANSVNLPSGGCLSSDGRPPQDRWIHVVWLLAAAWAVVLGYVAVQKYMNLHAGYDLAVFNQLLWNTLHGRPMECSSPWLQPYFGTHFAPFLYLLVPFYAIHPSPAWLILLQVAALASVGPVLAFACRNLGLSVRLGLVLTLSFYCHPSIQGIALDDFHVMSFAPALMALAVLAISLERGDWAIVCLGLLATVREDFSVVATLFALAWWLQAPRQVRRLVPVAIIGVYGLAVLLIWMPALRQGAGAPFLQRLGVEGSYLSVVGELLNPMRWFESLAVPARLGTAFSLLLATAAAPLLVPRWWLVLLVPGIVFLLGQERGMYENIAGHPLHYTGAWAASIFAITPFGLRRWSELMPKAQTERLLVLALLLGTLFVSGSSGYIGVRDLWKAQDRAFWTTVPTHRENAHTIARSLSPELRLIASHRLISLVSDRENLWVPEQIPVLRDEELPVFLLLERQVIEDTSNVEFERFQWAFENGQCTSIHETSGIMLIRYDGPRG